MGIPLFNSSKNGFVRKRIISYVTETRIGRSRQKHLLVTPNIGGLNSIISYHQSENEKMKNPLWRFLYLFLISLSFLLNSPVFFYFCPPTPSPIFFFWGGGGAAHNFKLFSAIPIFTCSFKNFLLFPYICNKKALKIMNFPSKMMP